VVAIEDDIVVVVVNEAVEEEDMVVMTEVEVEGDMSEAVVEEEVVVDTIQPHKDPHELKLSRLSCTPTFSK
jgi:ABC-type Zn uptake system ZnuABC Zn-binding protein ZnuA